MLLQELYELLKLNCGLTDDYNANNLITATKEQLNRDIPSEIHHEVKQQVHWFIVEAKKLWKQVARKEKTFLHKKWLPKICAETDKKARQGIWSPSDHLGPPEIQGPCDSQKPQ